MTEGEAWAVLNNEFVYTDENLPKHLVLTAEGLEEIQMKLTKILNDTVDHLIWGHNEERR